MISKEVSLSEASGPPAIELLPVQTTRNTLLYSLKHFPQKIAISCFSETDAVLEGLDLAHQNHQNANGQPNGSANGLSNGQVNGSSTHVKPEYLRLSYSQLYAAALRFATTLHSRGVNTGDTITTVMYTGVEVTIVAWAAFLLGARWVPLHPRTATNAKELNHVLNLTEPVAFVAYDGEVAQNLEINAFAQNARVKIVSSEGSRKGWSPWRDCLSDRTPLLNIIEDTDKACESQYTMVVFTSGTTSMPKAAAHTNLTFGKSYTPAADFFDWDSNTVVLHCFPFHHIGGNFPAMAAWCRGGNVVIPSKSFSAEKAVKAMWSEPLTTISVLPSMMLAMQEYDPTPYRRVGEKLITCMSATTILREHYNSAKQYFDTTHFTAPYGLSEGLPVSGRIYDVSKFNPAPGPINPGPPISGVKVKVCAQGSKDPVPRNEIGELHQAGWHVVPGYLKLKVDEFYTDDEGLPWFMTGDAARMDENDDVEILGRIKDMIIRGGVNISPARIEDVVNKLPGVDVSVIAAIDVISGEVPVAVLRYTSSDRSTTPIEIRESVLKELGPTFALSDVILLEELGLSDWPKTTSGKVRKVELRSFVKAYMDTKATDAEDLGEKPLIETLKEIWSQTLGLPASKLSPDTDLRDLADSLTTMQFRARLRKTLGKNLSTQQLLQAFTIAAQAKVLEESKNAPTSRPTLVTKREGPPELDDVAFADGDEKRFESLKRIVETQLTDLGLTWEKDVEDLIPLWDWGKLEGRRYRPKSMTHRHAFIADELSKQDLRRIFEKAISLHPILRSLGVQEGEGDDRFLAFLRAGPKYFDNCIYDAGTVEKGEDLAQLFLKDAPGNTFFPGLLFKIILADVKETNTAGFIFVSQHTIFDASSLSLFFENFELVKNGLTPIERTSYKPWADMYYNNRTSAKATEAVKKRAEKLRGISSLKKALWPPQKAPGFFLGDDWQWLDPESMQPGDSSLRKCEDPDQNVSSGLQERGLSEPYDQGVTCAFELPDLFKLQQTHGVHPVTLVQSSLALANMYLTKQSSAFLTLANAGRVWPFLQTEVAELLPEPIDVDGPMVILLPHPVHLPTNGSVITFLQEQQQEQQFLSRYVHAPFLRIQEEVGPADGDMMLQVIRHQVFNWLPLIGSGGMPLKGFKAVQKTHHNDIMATWAAGMPNPETVVVHTDVDRAQLTVKEVQRIQKLLEQAALWMCDEQNWQRDPAAFLSLEL